MKDFTKLLKAECKKDQCALSAHSNSKINARSLNQNEQALNDKKNFYVKKWTGYLLKAETVAQKRYCYNMFGRIAKISKWF